MLYVPVIGSFLEASGLILEKKVLRRHNINVRNYIVYAFFSIILVMLPFIYFFWRLDSGALLLGNLIVFVLVVFVSVLANVFIIYSLKREDLVEVEPVRLMQPLFIILLTFIFSFFFVSYSDERNFLMLVLAVIASVALIVSHIKKSHFVFNKYLISALIGSFLFAVELVISKSILLYYSPLTFYFLRSLFVFVIALLIFYPKLNAIKKKTALMIFVASAIWVVHRVILYWGYLELGILLTTVLFILAPVLIFLFAKIFLKEKLTLRNILASIVIVACVVVSIFVGA